MKYTILINQLQTIRLCEKTKVDLDVTDMTIYQFIADFVNSPLCEWDATREWFWISTAKIIMEMPLLRLKWRQIDRHIDKLIAAGLLIRNPRNKQNAVSYFKFGGNYNEYLFENTIVKNDNAIVKNDKGSIVKNDNDPLSKMTNNKTIDILNYNSSYYCDFPENHAALAAPPQKNDNKNSSVNTEIEKEKSSAQKEKEIDFDAIAALFNRLMDENHATIPRISKMTAKRKTMLTARLKEFPDANLTELFTAIAQSSFLNGGGNHGWTADFDWIIRPNNFPKILEGKYKNAKNAQIDARNFKAEQLTTPRELDW